MNVFAPFLATFVLREATNITGGFLLCV